ncbi:DUF370 domain-containing protein [bacterium]|nr:DUF370 domain-containing protein [bacterium]
MTGKYVDLGHGNFIDATRIVGVIGFNSSPARKLKKLATEEGRKIDSTQGSRTKCLIITDSDHIWLCGLERDKLLQKLTKNQ